MGPQKDVIDIVTELGGIRTAKDADKLFEERLEADQLSRLNKIQNEAVRMKIANAILLSSWLGKEVELPVDEDLYLAEFNKRIIEEGKYPPRS